MLEGGAVEVGVQALVQHVEQVEVERSGDSGRVVVGRDQDGGGFDQVGAEEEVVVVAELRA